MIVSGAAGKKGLFVPVVRGVATAVCADLAMIRTFAGDADAISVRVMGARSHRRTGGKSSRSRIVFGGRGGVGRIGGIESCRVAEMVAIVGAVDCDGYGLFRPIDGRDREGVGQSLAGRKRLHGTVGGVERVGPHTGGGHRESCRSRPRSVSHK